MYAEASNSTWLLLLNTAVFPFIATVLFTVVFSKLALRIRSLGLLIGFLVGLKLIYVSLSFPPTQALDYLLLSGVLGGGLSIANQQTLPRKVAMFFALALISFYFLLQPVLRHGAAYSTLLWSLACALFISLIYIVHSHQAETANKPISLITLMFIAGASAPIVGIGGSLLISQLLGAIAASLLAFIIVSYLFRKTSDNSTPIALFILGGLLAQAHILADIPLITMVAMLISATIAPLILWFKPQNIKLALSLQTSITTAIAGTSLWYVWPASSLY